MSVIPQLYNVKSPSEHLHARMLMKYPSDTPFGNLMLSQLDIIRRIDYLNTKLEYLFNQHEAIIPKGAGIADDAVLWIACIIEEVVFQLRKVMDSLICLTSILYEYRNTGKYPDKIACDSIGGLLERIQKDPNSPDMNVYVPHCGCLKTINDAINAYKHSYINHETLLKIGAKEPVVTYIYMKHNVSGKRQELQSIPVSKIVSECSNIVKDVLGKHKEWLAPGQ